jgi:hypothetical protein
MFSPAKAATLAFRESAAGLAVNAIGAVLQVMGKLFAPSPAINAPDDRFDPQFWLYWLIAPSILLAISLWTSRQVRAAMQVPTSSGK